MAVPDTNTFSLQDVSTEIYGDTNYGRNLLDCFDDSEAAGFDSRYGSKTMSPKSLYGFRNYVVPVVKFGKLYNWSAVNAILTTGQPLAPYGWHVPSDDEWTTLQNYLVANGYNYDGTTSGGFSDGMTVANKIAKSLAATTNWGTRTEVGAIGNDLSLNNTSFFNAMPSGYWDSVAGEYVMVGGYSDLWSSTSVDTSNAWFRGLFLYANYLKRSYYAKSAGFSVRCIRDSGNSAGTATDYDGNVYESTSIGTQVWLTSNLRNTHYANGDSIPSGWMWDCQW